MVKQVLCGTVVMSSRVAYHKAHDLLLSSLYLINKNSARLFFYNVIHRALCFVCNARTIRSICDRKQSIVESAADD